jgi:hypothetical protein
VHDHQPNRDRDHFWSRPVRALHRERDVERARDVHDSVAAGALDAVGGAGRPRRRPSAGTQLLRRQPSTPIDRRTRPLIVAG